MSTASSSIVWHHSSSEGSARLVLLAIADHDGEGGSWPSISTLARMARVSDSTVRRCVKALTTLGELAVHHQEGGTARTPEHLRPNRYEIRLMCPPACDGTSRHACRTCRERGNEHRPECPDLLSTGVSPVTGGDLSTGVSPVTPHPLSPVTPHPLSPVTPEPPPEPSVTTTPGEPEQVGIPESVVRVWEGEGISKAHQDALWLAVISDPATTLPAARAKQRAWFVQALAAIKSKDAAAKGAALGQVRKYGVVCEHGEPGGSDLHPTTGLPLCPLCRRKALA